MLRNRPAISLTTLHKRHADIYFVLLHEIAHLKTDFNKAKSKYLVQDEEENTNIKKNI